MEITNEHLLRLYEQRVRNLDEADEAGTDEQLALVTRDLIVEREWSSSDQRTIDRLDSVLASHWQQFDKVFPNVSQRDRQRWWWFLQEGPHVREDAARLSVSNEKVRAVL